MQRFVVLPFDDQVAWIWAQIMTISGHPIAPGDAWVAACAMRHGLPLVTHNARHFEHISGLKLILAQS